MPSMEDCWKRSATESVRQEGGETYQNWETHVNRILVTGGVAGGNHQVFHSLKG